MMFVTEFRFLYDNNSDHQQTSHRMSYREWNGNTSIRYFVWCLSPHKHSIQLNFSSQWYTLDRTSDVNTSISMPYELLLAVLGRNENFLNNNNLKKSSFHVAHERRKMLCDVRVLHISISSAFAGSFRMKQSHSDNKWIEFVGWKMIWKVNRNR